jgi:hypothetical protein
MLRNTLWVAVLAMLSATRAYADISGDWQGTLNDSRPLRLILHIARYDDAWALTMP